MSKEIEKYYADRFKCRLQQHLSISGFTQQEIANKAGISQATLALILTGMRTPSFRAVCRIANAFKEPLGNFF